MARRRWWLLMTICALSSFCEIDANNLSCECSTLQCRSDGVSRCHGAFMCFTQYLKRRDNSDPIVKGCVLMNSSLLCENRRPSVANWPFVACCRQDMCNKELLEVFKQLLRSSTKNTTLANNFAERTSNQSTVEEKSSPAKQITISNQSATVLADNLERHGSVEALVGDSGAEPTSNLSVTHAQQNAYQLPRRTLIVQEIPSRLEIIRAKSENRTDRGFKTFSESLGNRVLDILRQQNKNGMDPTKVFESGDRTWSFDSLQNSSLSSDVEEWSRRSLQVTIYHGAILLVALACLFIVLLLGFVIVRRQNRPLLKVQESTTRSPNPGSVIFFQKKTASTRFSPKLPDGRLNPPLA